MPMARYGEDLPALETTLRSRVAPPSRRCARLLPAPARSSGAPWTRHSRYQHPPAMLATPAIEGQPTWQPDAEPQGQHHYATLFDRSNSLATLIHRRLSSAPTDASRIPLVNGRRLPDRWFDRPQPVVESQLEAHQLSKQRVVSRVGVAALSSELAIQFALGLVACGVRGSPKARSG